MEVNRDIRMTETFFEFLKSLEPKVRKKYLYVIQVLKTESVVSEKFIKHLENTNLYEMRVSLSSNEYRTIVFSIDAVNIISATKVLLAYYYAELLKEQRKQQKMTQQQLADKIGKKREYISNIERGNSDMQLSTFMQIANALGLRFALVVG